MNKDKNITFEDALKDLEEIVDNLNNDELDLEKAISAYEKGMKLKKICEKRLDEAKLRIEIIKDEKLEKSE
ncbi:MAG: exodeoxyribonuclease VII small subunit [Pseudomonadota bacterium]|nr:exodeoxyribonuclease VII small subunit [Pseudomonadota bacterium]